MHLRRAALGVLVTLGLSGCDSPSAPVHGMGGTWVLRSIGESILPAPVFKDDTPLLLLSDTLVFGIWHPSYSKPAMEATRRTSYSGEHPTRGTGYYGYARTGNTVTMHLLCAPDALCLADERHGVIDGNTMTLEYSSSSGWTDRYRSPLVYQRVR